MTIIPFIQTIRNLIWEEGQKQLTGMDLVFFESISKKKKNI